MTSKPSRQEETEETELCHEVYGLHIGCGNDSANESRRLMRNLWEARTQIKQQEARIQRLTQSLKEIQKLVKQGPLISPEAANILNWTEDGLRDEQSPTPRHSFSSATTQALTWNEEEADMPLDSNDFATRESQKGRTRSSAKSKEDHDTQEPATDPINGLYDQNDPIIRTIRGKLVAMRDERWHNRFEVKYGFFLAEAYVQQLTTLTGSEYNSPEVMDWLRRCLPLDYRDRIRARMGKASGDLDLKQFREAMIGII